VSRFAVILLLALLGCGGQGPTSEPAPARRRAIFASFDAFNADRARRTVQRAAIPEFLRLLGTASCADARPMWPSVTAASHAALWTGVWGDVNGVIANTQVPLPWGEFSLLEQLSGFEARELGAEPIWITAARAGRPAVAHHTTQVGQPGYWLPGGGRDSARWRADSVALADPALFVLNGFSGGPGPRLLTQSAAPLRPAGAWAGIGTLGLDAGALRELSWQVGRDTLYALLFQAAGAGHVIVAPARDVARGVRIRAVPVERDGVTGRALARHFSEVLWLPDPAGGRAGLYFRLWELASDFSSYQLYQSGRQVIRTNQPDVLRAYEDAVGGFILGPGSNVLREAGPTLAQGGDGSTELKYLETAELQTRQFISGSEWVWRTRRPDLQTEYFSLADGLDHTWYGDVAPEVPGQDRAVAARVNAMRSRGWALVDLRLASLRALAREAGALLLIGGDHGMRAVWRSFHVNVALRNSGLLAVDAAGRPDLTRTLAYSPNGYYIQVNRAERKGGVVPASELGRVADSVIAVLRAVRDPAGVAVVTEARRPRADDSLGIGGPAGGDVYYGLAPGYGYSGALGDSLTSAREPTGYHGLPSTEPDMRTTLCAIGPGVGGRRLPIARVIDAAPTVSDWLGIPAPREARGRSLLDLMRSR
jgi:hypothetical protein